MGWNWVVGGNMVEIMGDVSHIINNKLIKNMNCLNEWVKIKEKHS